MYLKCTVDGQLDGLVRLLWPNGDLMRDYENVYEWVWLKLPEHNLRLNFSREHEWGEESRIYPIYVSAFSLESDEFVDEIPGEIIDIFLQGLKCKIEVYSGRANVDEEDGIPTRILNSL